MHSLFAETYLRVWFCVLCPGGRSLTHLALRPSSSSCFFPSRFCWSALLDQHANILLNTQIPVMSPVLSPSGCGFNIIAGHSVSCCRPEAPPPPPRLIKEILCAKGGLSMFMRCCTVVHRGVVYTGCQSSGLIEDRLLICGCFERAFTGFRNACCGWWSNNRSRSKKTSLLPSGRPQWPRLLVSALSDDEVV